MCDFEGDRNREMPNKEDGNVGSGIFGANCNCGRQEIRLPPERTDMAMNFLLLHELGMVTLYQVCDFEGDRMWEKPNGGVGNVAGRDLRGNCNCGRQEIRLSPEGTGIAMNFSFVAQAGDGYTLPSVKI